MKILHLNDHLAAVGGVETYLLGLVPRLETLGHEVLVGYSSGDGGVVNRAEQLRHLGSIQHGDIQRGREEIENLIAREQPDVVHLHGIQNLGAIQAAVSSGRAVMHGHDFRQICPASNFFYKRTQEVCQRTCGIGCFATTAIKHCMTPRPGAAMYFYKRARWVMKNASRFGSVIAPSEAARQRFLAAGFAAGQVIKNPYFCPIEVRDTLRPLPKVPTVTFLGRASYNKGWEVFIKAVGELPSTVRGLMIGNFSVSDQAEITRLAGLAGCSDRLNVEGWAGRDAISKVFERTSVLAFPSLWPETMGIVGVEALSQGIPVVASDVGGVREWLRDGENGRLVPPKDSAAIAAGVLEFVESPERIEEAGAAGMRLVREKFSSARHLEKLMNIYKTVSV